MKLEPKSSLKTSGQTKGTKSTTTPGAINRGALMDRGAFDFHARISEHEGDIMSAATREVITIPPTTRIIDAIKIMTRNNFRHIPITDAGTNRIEGIVSSFDVIDFLGGGDKNKLIENRYHENLLSAINANVSTIMQHRVVSIRSDGNIKEAFDLMLKNNIGSLPIVDSTNNVRAICTEKDFLKFTAGIVTNKTVADHMSKRVEKAPAEMTISDAAKMMVKNHFRRLPVVKGDILIGVVNASDIMDFLGSGEAFEKLTTGNIHDIMDAPISTLIAKDVVWTTSDTDLGKASELMVKNSIGALPVIDNGKLCGIITERDVLRAMAE